MTTHLTTTLALSFAVISSTNLLAASVTILAATPFGEILSPIQVVRFQADAGSGRDYASQFENARAIGVPTGRYSVLVRAGGRGIGGFVQVWRDDTLLVLSGSGIIVERGPGTLGVVGKVIGAEGTSPVWVRLVRTFSEDLCCTIVPLSKDGTFSFGGLGEADYVLLVLSDGRVLFEGRVRIESPNALIAIDLAKGTATVQPK
jgi:hypothetical protein